MYNTLQLGIKYINFLLTANNGRGHGMHSPFVYDLIRNVLMDKTYHEAYKKPEEYRKKLLNDDSVLEIEDMGAGSVSGTTKKRTVSEIAKTSVKHKRYSQLLYRLASYYKYGRILELGTSLGVTSSYLAQVPVLEELVTMEGADAVADIAEGELSKYGKVRVVRGNFDQQVAGGRLQVAVSGEQEAVSRTNLEKVVSDMPRIDLAFVDGNHRKEPTLRYFETIFPKTHEGSCIIFDDIHWSAEMEEAWEKIRKDERVKLSIDLFFIGIVFFRTEFREKQHFSIRY
ncbi:MAG TPA: class I SAM-dependent methyltransferase [Chitinophagaceae bacterium]|nr:class I SAM-dependent methyltransferase [Chitinophagaceae bacterium]